MRKFLPTTKRVDPDASESESSTKTTRPRPTTTTTGTTSDTDMRVSATTSANGSSSSSGMLAGAINRTRRMTSTDSTPDDDGSNGTLLLAFDQASITSAKDSHSASAAGTTSRTSISRRLSRLLKSSTLERKQKSNNKQDTTVQHSGGDLLSLDIIAGQPTTSSSSGGGGGGGGSEDNSSSQRTLTSRPSVVAGLVAKKELTASDVVKLNIGGQQFTTMAGTLMQYPDSLLGRMLLQGENMVVDAEGDLFVDRDPKHFGLILNFLRDGACPFPQPGTPEWEEIKSEAAYYHINKLQTEMKELEMESLGREQRLAYLREKLDGDDESIITLQARELERMRVELQRLQFENAKFGLLSKHRYYANDLKDFAFNILMVGVTGTGKSSSLNTILDSAANVVSGAQAQGTRGITLKDGIIDEKHFCSYIDTQGLGADTSMSDQALLSHIMMHTESILQMDIINNVLISLDLSARATPAVMANQFTLMELFSSLRQSCFLVLTKWNTNAVMSEWNLSLRKWVRKYRRVKNIDLIKEDPPSYSVMYREYCDYLLNSMAHGDDTRAMAKMAVVLAYFESRMIWMFNLDAIQVEDKFEGELEPYIERMYHFYRFKAMSMLYKGSYKINVSDLVFLTKDEDTLLSVANQLVESRDRRISLLEDMVEHPANRAKLRSLVRDMGNLVAQRVDAMDFAPSGEYLARVAELTDDSKAVRFGSTSDHCIVS